MTLDQIEAFLAVVKHKNMTQAAETLFISQPTLSYRIETLESELNVSLFARHKGQRKIQLTKQGISFIPRAEQWLRLWKETINSLNTADNIPFSITLIHSSTYALATDVLQKFFSRNLPIYTFLNSSTSMEIYESLEKGTTDVALLNSYAYSSGKVILTPFAKEEIVLVCNHDSSLKNSVDIKELDQKNEIFLSWGLDFDAWHNNYIGSESNAFLRTTIANFENILWKPDLWSFLPKSIALKLCMNNGTRICSTNIKPPNRILYLGTTSSSQQPYTDYFIADLISTMQNKDGIQLIKSNRF